MQADSSLKTTNNHQMTHRRARMENIFEFFGFIVALIVLCFITFFVYKAIGSKIAGKIFLVISSIVILHLLMVFLFIYAGPLLPSFLAPYAAWIIALIF
jgi:hypothetical protein